MQDLTYRPRRLRRTAAIRDMVQETELTVKDLIYPLFVMEGENTREEVGSMPGSYRYTLDLLLKEVQEAYDLGIRAIALFPAVPEKKKDSHGTESFNPDGLIPQALRAIKASTPDITLITDVALDPYNIDGHDGIVQDGIILNDETVEVLVKQALCQRKRAPTLLPPQT